MDGSKQVTCVNCRKDFNWDGDVELEYCCDEGCCECKGRIITEVVCDSCIIYLDNFLGYLESHGIDTSVIKIEESEIDE